LEAIEQQIVLFLQNLFHSIGWAGVIAAMTVESACIPLPSEVTMPLAGWMLIQAKGLPVWHTLLAGLCGAIGCTMGSILTYWIGASGGRPVLEKYGRYVLISRHDIEVADSWFKRYGEATAFFSRLLPIVRTFISLPAGVARMGFVRFVSYSFVGSFIWCVVLGWAGYTFGEHWQEVRAWMRPFDIPIAILLIVLFAWFVYHKVRTNRKHATHPVEDVTS